MILIYIRIRIVFYNMALQNYSLHKFRRFVNGITFSRIQELNINVQTRNVNLPLSYLVTIPNRMYYYKTISHFHGEEKSCMKWNTQR